MKLFTSVWDNGAARRARVAVSMLTALVAAACGAPDPMSGDDGEEPIGTETQALGCARSEASPDPVSLGRHERSKLDDLPLRRSRHHDGDCVTTGGNTGSLARTYDGHNGHRHQYPVVSRDELRCGPRLCCRARSRRVAAARAEFDRKPVCFQTLELRHDSARERVRNEVRPPKKKIACWSRWGRR